VRTLGPLIYNALAMPEKKVYKIIFHSQGQVYEIYAKSVSQGSLFGFVEVEQLVFGEKTQIVVDPSEEQLKNEFAGVRRTYLPMHAVIRIDEVDKEGTGRISKEAKTEGGTLTPFPTPVFDKPRDPKK